MVVAIAEEPATFNDDCEQIKATCREIMAHGRVGNQGVSIENQIMAMQLLFDVGGGQEVWRREQEDRKIREESIGHINDQFVKLMHDQAELRGDQAQLRQLLQQEKG